MKIWFMVRLLALSAALLTVPIFAGDAAMTLHIKGMTCPACAASVERELTKLPEVAGVAVRLGSSTAKLSLKQGQKPSQESLEQAIKTAGFQLAKVEDPAAK